MRRIFSMRRAAFALFLLGVTAVAATHLGQRARPYVGQPFIMEFRQVYRDAAGNERLEGTGTRWQGSNGAWKSVTNYLDRAGNFNFALITYSVPGRGVYAVRGGKLVYVSEASTNWRRLSVEEMRQHANYVREEKVLGFDAVVMNTNSPPGMVIQEFIFPQLQGLPLKSVDITPSGEGTTVEPVRIELTEPSADIFRLPDLPEDDSYYRQKQARVASKGGGGK